MKFLTGKLHRPQIIGDNEKIRYSGSPHILSFSEVGYQKKILTLIIKDNSIQKIEETLIPEFRAFYKLTGSLQECVANFSTIQTNHYNLKPWVEIILAEDNTINTDNLKKSAAKYDFEILKISLKNERKQQGIEELLENTKSIKELNPSEVFKLKCKEMQVDLKQKPAIWDAFNEILQSVKNQ